MDVLGPCPWRRQLRILSWCQTCSSIYQKIIGSSSYCSLMLDTIFNDRLLNEVSFFLYINPSLPLDWDLPPLSPSSSHNSNGGDLNPPTYPPRKPSSPPVRHFQNLHSLSYAAAFTVDILFLQSIMSACPPAIRRPNTLSPSAPIFTLNRLSPPCVFYSGLFPLLLIPFRPAFPPPSEALQRYYHPRFFPFPFYIYLHDARPLHSPLFSLRNRTCNRPARHPGHLRFLYSSFANAIPAAIPAISSESIVAIFGNSLLTTSHRL